MRTPEPTWELVLKRNPVERLKQEKSPLGILERAPRADRRRLRARGRGGHRPAEVVGPLPRQAEGRDVHAADQAPRRPADAGAAPRDRRDLERGSAAATASSRPARTSSCTGSSSRRCPRSSTRLDAAGLTTAGGCGDTVRNITGCPVAGRRRTTSCSTRHPSLEEAAAFFYGHPDYSDLPRKHKITIAACARPLQRARDQLHRARRRRSRRARGLRGARRRRALLGAATRPRPRRLRAEGGGARGPARAPRRLARGPHATASRASRRA